MKRGWTENNLVKRRGGGVLYMTLEAGRFTTKSFTLKKAKTSPVTQRCVPVCLCACVHVCVSGILTTCCELDCDSVWGRGTVRDVSDVWEVGVKDFLLTFAALMYGIVVLLVCWLICSLY